MKHLSKVLALAAATVAFLVRKFCQCGRSSRASSQRRHSYRLLAGAAILVSYRGWQSFRRGAFGGNKSPEGPGHYQN